MTRFRTILFMLLAAVLGACMNVNDPDKLKQIQTLDLCESYYFATRPASGRIDNSWPDKNLAIKKELERRNVVTPAEWISIDHGQIQEGSSECALRAAWGFPQRVDRAATNAGNTAHYVYSQVRYADLVNGKVTVFKY